MFFIPAPKVSFTSLVTIWRNALNLRSAQQTEWNLDVLIPKAVFGEGCSCGSFKVNQWISSFPASLAVGWGHFYLKDIMQGFSRDFLLFTLSSYSIQTSSGVSNCLNQLKVLLRTFSHQILMWLLLAHELCVDVTCVLLDEYS